MLVDPFGERFAADFDARWVRERMAVHSEGDAVRRSLRVAPSGHAVQQ